MYGSISGKDLRRGWAAGLSSLGTPPASGNDPWRRVRDRVPSWCRRTSALWRAGRRSVDNLASSGNPAANHPPCTPRLRPSASLKGVISEQVTADDADARAVASASRRLAPQSYSRRTAPPPPCWRPGGLPKSSAARFDDKGRRGPPAPASSRHAGVALSHPKSSIRPSPASPKCSPQRTRPRGLDGEARRRAGRRGALSASRSGRPAVIDAPLTPC